MGGRLKMKNKEMSGKQKEINRIKNQTKLLLDKIKKQKIQLGKDYKFKKFIKEHSSELYWKAVALTSQEDKRK